MQHISGDTKFDRSHSASITIILPTNHLHNDHYQVFLLREGRCKIWTVDFGLDCGLDYGLDYGPDCGLKFLLMDSYPAVK